MYPGCEVITIEKNSEEIEKGNNGAAWDCLKASHFIDNDNPLLIMNSDQLIEWDAFTTLEKVRYSRNKIDGTILCFERENDPKWCMFKTINMDLSVKLLRKYLSQIWLQLAIIFGIKVLILLNIRKK
jgi:hypothetical protein